MTEKVKEDNYEQVDVINKPSHYMSGGLEVIDILKAKLTPEEYEGFLKGLSLKYIFRAGKKAHNDAKQDIQKAEWYLQKLEEFLSEDDKK